MKPEKNLQKEKNIGTIIFVSLIALIIIVVIMSMNALKNNRMLKIFGYSFSVVVTDSMEDTIMVNDVIIIKDVPFSEIKYKGNDPMDEDIIVYYNAEKNINVVHRIYGIAEDGKLLTKGDNPKAMVDAIHTDETIYRGKVVTYGKFLGLGYLINEGRSIIFIIILVIFAILLISETMNFISLKKEKQAIAIKEAIENKETTDEEKEQELLLLKQKLEKMKNKHKE